MGYEIPQQLAYKEKILFGLTFAQVGYAFVGLPLMVSIFFKTQNPLALKIFLVALIGSLTAGCMFFKLPSQIMTWYKWWRQRKIERPDKRKAFLGFKEIKDNLIIRNDGKKLAVLKVESINFSIKPKETQDAVMGMFQKFLNGIDFPVQIAMYTEALDLSGHFTSLQEKVKGDKQFVVLAEKYQEHLESLSVQHQIMNRSFYMIIPEKNDLIIQLELCKKRLSSIGLLVKQLTNTELNDIVKNFFSLKNEVPENIENKPSFVKIDGAYQRVLYAHGYPRNVEAGFLDRIVSLLGKFDFSLHIEPYDIETMMITLNRELQKQRADLYASQIKGTLNPSLEIKYADTKAILENLQKGKEKLFNVSLYINCRAESLEALNFITRKVESELNALLIIPKQASFKMIEGIQSCAPLGLNKLKAIRNVPTEALSAFFPFTSSFLSADLSGIWFGLNKNNIPLIKDIFKLSNPNGLCLASSGAGKSYLSKLMIARHLLNGTKVMIIDPQGEYNALIAQFKGQRIDLSRTSKTIINPLDLMGHEYPEKRLALMDLMPLMLGDLTEPQKAFMDRALTMAYENKGIFINDERSWDNEPPIMEDVFKALEMLERRATQLEKPTIRSLMNRLALYTTGVFSFLNTHTKINFDNNLVSFDIGSLPKQVKPVMMFLVLDYIYMKMKQDLERKLLVIDEAWSLLGHAEEASYIFEIVKTCRKFNLALYLINQEVEGMLGTQAGKSVLANSSYTILLRQKPAVIRNIRDTFSLSESEKAFLLTAAVGEGILLMDDEHSELKIIASPEEHKYITTNPDELLKDSKKIENEKIIIKPTRQRKVEITADESKHLHLYKKLKIDDVKYLILKDFKKVKQVNILGKKELYLIKPRHGESEGHCFLTYDIAEYLKQFTDKIEIYQTKKPDIVFTIKEKRYAVEVETGRINNKTQTKNKVQLLNKEYGKDWFFVVTDYNIAPSYRKFGETLTKRSVANKIRQLAKNGKK